MGTLEAKEEGPVSGGTGSGMGVAVAVAVAMGMQLQSRRVERQKVERNERKPSRSCKVAEMNALYSRSRTGRAARMMGDRAPPAKVGAAQPTKRTARC